MLGSSSDVDWIAFIPQTDAGCTVFFVFENNSIKKSFSLFVCCWNTPCWWLWRSAFYSSPQTYILKNFDAFQCSPPWTQLSIASRLLRMWGLASSVWTYLQALRRSHEMLIRKAERGYLLWQIRYCSRFGKGKNAYCLLWLVSGGDLSQHGALENLSWWWQGLAPCPSMALY